MTLRIRFYIAMLVAIIVVCMHKLAFDLSLYWIFRQTDILMHIAGGFMSALFILVTLRYFKVKEVWKNVFIGILIVGITWELLEVFYKVADIDVYYWVDTTKDLIDDVIGAYLGLMLWNKLPEPKSTKADIEL